VVLQAAQVNVGADRSGPQYRHELIRQRGDDNLILDQVERRIANRNVPTAARWPELILDDVGHDIIPRSLGEHWIRSRQISHSNPAAGLRCFLRFVFVEDEPIGFLTVFGVKAGALAREVIFAIEPAVLTFELNHSESLFHTYFMVGPSDSTDG